jgi:hypothetical protein
LNSAIHLIKQPPKELGCGIASVAMVSRKTYCTVKEKLVKLKEWGPKKRTFRTHPQDISSLLNIFSIEHKLFFFNSFSEIEKPSLVPDGPASMEGACTSITRVNTD